MSDDESREDLWPAWNQPVTQGDLVAAMIRVRSCVVDTWIALSALRRGDKDRFDEAVEQLNEADEKLSAFLESLAGGMGGND